MKKFLFGLLALILAAGITAFAISSKDPAKGSAFTNLYWYEVTYDEDFPDGVIESSSDIMFSGVAQPKPYADANDGCSGTVKHCLRGFSSPLVSFPSINAPADATTKN